MASFLSLYNEIEYKIKQTIVRYNEYKEENEQLKINNHHLEEEVEELNLKIAELEEKLKLVSITKTILNRKDKQETKKEINDLVREIDNCIKLLNSEHE